MEDRAVVCISCNGSGWKPVDGALQARPCECQGELRRRNRTAAAAIPKRYYHCRLSNFRDRGNVSIYTIDPRAFLPPDAPAPDDTADEKELLRKLAAGTDGSRQFPRPHGRGSVDSRRQRGQ